MTVTLTQDRLFGRRVVFNANGTAYEGLRTAFKVNKYLQGKPNDAEITIYNLSAESRKKLQGKDIPIQLKAGYSSNFAQIFSGTTRTISHVKEKADWVTKISAGDGEQKIRTNRAVVSYKGGTPIVVAVNGIAQATGLDLGNLKAKISELPGGQSQVVNGFSDSGQAYPMLQRYLNALGYSVSVQDGALSVIKQVTPGKPLDTTFSVAVLISQTTGMIGSPEICEKGTDKKQVLKVKSLLQPQLVPGGLVQLDSANLKGAYRIEHVSHDGDLFETRFYSQLELKVIAS